MLNISKSLQPLAKHLLLKDKSGVFFIEKLKVFKKYQGVITQTDKANSKVYPLSFLLSLKITIVKGA